jgi:hypothetical protein
MEIGLRENVAMDFIKVFYEVVNRMKLGPESLLQLFSHLRLPLSYLHLIPSFFIKAVYDSRWQKTQLPPV